MSARRLPLDQVRVASPCEASWDAMEGDGRVRFCRACRLYVYNLSGMTRPQAEALVQSAEGRLCVRFYRRADGTVLTRDCPVGLAAWRRTAAVLVGVAVFFLVTLVGTLTAATVGVVLALGRRDADPGTGRKPPPPPQRVIDWFNPEPPPVVMGGLCPPGAPPAPDVAPPPGKGPQRP
jgi:hypothetical protein